MIATLLLSAALGLACTLAWRARGFARSLVLDGEAACTAHNARRFWTLRLDRGPLLGAPVVFIVEAPDEAHARHLASMRAAASGSIVRRCAEAFLDPARTSCRSHGPLIRLRVA